MEQNNPTIAYIVPTKDRPEDLRKLLRSFSKQTRPVNQIIIVDGGDRDIKYIVEEFPELAIDYTIVRPPGLTKQRNVGKSMVRRDIALVGYLDDDIVMEPDANDVMTAYFAKAPAHLGGASFNIVNNPVNTQHIYKRLFYLDNGKKGVLLPSGVNLIVSPVTADTYTEWLSGGATVWRKEITDSYDYDEHFRGYGHFDDLDFSFRVNMKYSLVVLKEARVAHYCAPLKTDKNYSFGVLDVSHRFYFVNKYPQRFSNIKCFWATCGMILLYVFFAVKHRDTGHFNRARGFIAGLWHVATSRAMSADANLK